MDIRLVSIKNFDQIWPIFKEIVVKGDTYAFNYSTEGYVDVLVLFNGGYHNFKFKISSSNFKTSY